MSNEQWKEPKLSGLHPAILDEAFLRLPADPEYVADYSENLRKILTSQDNEHVYQLWVMVSDLIDATEADPNSGDEASGSFQIGCLVAHHALSMQYQEDFPELEIGLIATTSRFPDILPLLLSIDDKNDIFDRIRVADKILLDSQTILAESPELQVVVEKYEVDITPTEFTKLRAGVGFVLGLTTPIINYKSLKTEFAEEIEQLNSAENRERFLRGD